MTPTEIIQALTALNQLAGLVTNIVGEFKGDFSSEDEAALQAELAKFRTANDAAYVALKGKLAEAAQRA